MNILTDALPDCVEINGCQYDINSDFRTGIRIMLDYESDKWTNQEKAYMMLRRLYGDNIPDDVEEAARLGIKFLNGGEESSEGENQDEPRRLYSFQKDAGLIFAAFKQTHGVDLDKESIHWWKFLALFMSMGGDTAFSNLVALRDRVTSGKASKEEQAAAFRMGDAFYVGEPERLTPEEQANADAFMEALNGVRI